MAVIGGGITGLTAAFELAEHPLAPADVLLFESGPRLGGKIQTNDLANGFVEAGPDSFLVREPWVEDLCRSVGLGDELISPEVFGAAVWVRGRLERFPTGSLWGLPGSPSTALRARPLSWSGRIRALGDLVLSGPLRGPDISVGELVRRRFGSEVLDRLVDPLLAGTRAGPTDEMSLAAALPQVDALARKGRSVMRGATKMPSASGAPPPFRSLKGGMRRLPERLADVLAPRVRLHTDAPVRSIRRTGDGYEVAMSDGRGRLVDAVIVTVPAPAAAEMLSRLSPASSKLLSEIRYSSVASVAMRVAPDSVRVPPGTSGVLVPSSEDRTISACTWWSTKWPGSGEGQIIRCFVGRASTDRPALEDDELVAACKDDVRALTGSAVEPLETSVTRWTQGLPEYRVGHLERIAEIETGLEEHPRVALAGAGLRGSGLPDCIAQAHVAVENILGVGQPH